jgi:hypothetical protein
LPDPNPMPTVCRTVLYTLDVYSAKQINKRRKAAVAHFVEHGDDSFQLHHGNLVQPGQQYPMIITRVWGDRPESAVNGQVFLDGSDSFWATSVVPGEGEGKYQWPTRS